MPCSTPITFTPYAHCQSFGLVSQIGNNSAGATPAYAGVAPAELLPIWDTKPNDWQWAYGVNVMGVLHGIQAFVPRMLAHGEESRVINTCSGNGAFINLPSTPIYTSSKALEDV